MDEGFRGWVPYNDSFLTAGSPVNLFERVASEVATEAQQKAQDALKDALLKVLTSWTCDVYCKGALSSSSES